MLDVWSERVDHLRRLAKQVGQAGQADCRQTIRRMDVILEDTREILSKSSSLSPEQWIDARTGILAGLQTLQREYNTALADWPQE